jgi:hypothetical protein
MLQDDSFNFDNAESEYNKQISLSPTNVKRERERERERERKY